MSVITVESRIRAVEGAHSILIDVGGLRDRNHADRALALLHGIIRAQVEEIDRLAKPEAK